MESLLLQDEFPLDVASELCKKIDAGEIKIESLEDVEERKKKLCKFLEELNPIDDDKRIYLDESNNNHTYYIDGKADYISVSTLGKQYWFDFKAHEDEIIANIFKSKHFKPGHKYFHKTSEEIKYQWHIINQDAVLQGKILHSFVEQFYNQWAKDGFKTTKESFDFLPKTVEYEQFKKFHIEVVDRLYKAFGFKIHRTEKRMFLEEYRLSGTLDAIFSMPPDPKTGEQEYVLLDWKRCKQIELRSEFGKKGKPPCQDLDDVNFYHYSINLSFYRYMLKTKYNIKIKDKKGMFLVVFHPNLPSYEMVELPYLEDIVLQILAKRKEELKNQSSNSLLDGVNVEELFSEPKSETPDLTEEVLKTETPKVEENTCDLLNGISFDDLFETPCSVTNNKKRKIT